MRHTPRGRYLVQRLARGEGLRDDAAYARSRFSSFIFGRIGSTGVLVYDTWLGFSHGFLTKWTRSIQSFFRRKRQLFTASCSVYERLQSYFLQKAMKMQRTPVHSDAPLCFSMHRFDDAKCRECPYELRCIKNSENIKGRFTLREVAEEALAKHRMGLWDESVTAVELLDLFIELWNKNGGKHRPAWRQQVKWRDAMHRVLHSCKHGGWNPRTFVKAQFTTVGLYCIKNSFKVVPAMLTGESALMRFQSWARTNERRYNDAHRDIDADPLFEELARAESLFGNLYVRSSKRHTADVEEEVFGEYRSWTLAITDKMPAIRLPAMSGACSSFHPLASSHILVPEDRFTWHDLRMVLFDTFTHYKEDDSELLTLDARLGEFL
jgi:hypothetical protein